MTELLVGMAVGCVLLGVGFSAGWRYRDLAGQSFGEPSVSTEERRGGSAVLEDWPTGEQE